MKTYNAPTLALSKQEISTWRMAERLHLYHYQHFKGEIPWDYLDKPSQEAWLLAIQYAWKVLPHETRSRWYFMAREFQENRVRLTKERMR